jgi:GH43 family beta-xylosidase
MRPYFIDFLKEDAKNMKLIFPKQGEPAAQPDPYIIYAEGKYFIYATGADGVEAYVSDRLCSNWQYLGVVLREEGMQEYWAPCAIERGGKYYMYYSSFEKSETDVHRQAIKVAIGDCPQGPFRYHNTVLPAFAIDPHVVKSGGDYYMIYSANDYESDRAGTYIAIDRMIDMFTVEGNPVRVVLPTLDEEIFMYDRFRKGQNWHTIEGGFYFRKGDDHYLTYSGNCYENEKYFVGYAYAHSTESDLRKIPFRKYPSDDIYAPLLAKNGEEEGTGHNSVIEENGEYYIVYHARDIGDRKSYDTRTARICPLKAEGEKLTVIRNGKEQ